MVIKHEAKCFNLNIMYWYAHAKIKPYLPKAPNSQLPCEDNLLYALKVTASMWYLENTENK